MWTRTLGIVAVLALSLLPRVAAANEPAAAAARSPFAGERPTATTFTLGEELPLPAPLPASDLPAAQDYRKHLRLADAGLVTFVGGVGLGVGGSIVLIQTLGGGDQDNIAPGVGLLIAGLAAAPVGLTLFTAGNLQAAYDLRVGGKVGPVVPGCIALGMVTTADLLLIAGAATTSTGSAPSGGLWALGGLLGVGALIPAFITYGTVRHRGAEFQASLAPSLVPVRGAEGAVSASPGLALSGTW